MKKKVSVLMVLALLVVSVFPLSSVFASSTWLLSGKPVNIIDSTNKIIESNIMDVTDSNKNAGYSISNNRRVEYVFPEPIDMTAFSIVCIGLSDVYLMLYNSDGERIANVAMTNNGQTSLVKEGVKRLVVYRASQSSSSALYDFNILGTVSKVVPEPEPEPEPELVPPYPVTSLQVSNVTENSAKLTWQNPSDITGVNIYKNDVLDTSLGVVSAFDITGLSEGSQYKYSVSTVNKDGLESTLASISFTTAVKEDNIPPAIPINLSADGGSGSVYLSWDAVKDDDLLGYNIYMSGEKINGSLVKTNFYNVVNLEFGKEYSFQVSAVDKSGNESDKSVVAIGTPSKIGLPTLKTNYELVDVAVGIEKWFSSFWLILAFAIGIPLSFYIASRVKLLFID